jgi:HK97 family phage major capsid protein/HK97 family phage prohead protease
MKPKKYPGTQVAYTDFDVEIASDAAAVAASADGRLTMIASNERPMERYGFTPDEKWGPYREQLEHSAEAVDLSRLKSGRAPVLEEHERGAQLGVIEEAKLVGKAMHLTVRFSKNAHPQEVLADIRDGIKRSVSIGWYPKRARLVEEDPEKGDLWRTTSWQPFEVSMVSVPANPEARVASNQGGLSLVPAQVEVIDQERGANMRLKGMIRDRQPNDGETPAATGAATAEITPVIEVEDKGSPDPRRSALSEASAIIEVCTRLGVPSKAREFIAAGLTIDQVNAELLKSVRPGVRPDSPMPHQAGVTVADRALDGMSPKERGAYSFRNAIEMAAGLKQRGGLEMEVSESLEKQVPSNFTKHGGVFIPMDLRSPDQQWEAQLAALNGGGRTASLDSKTLTKGNEVVFEQPGQLIELLRNRTQVIALGAQTLSGLTGPIPFPKQTGAMTMFWVGENPSVDVTQSDLTLGLATLAPKAVQGSTQYSRQLFTQASIDVESMVRRELSIGHSTAIDRAAIHGLGAAGEPMGVYVTPNVNSKAMGGQPTYPLLVDMAGLVADKNADEGSLGWLTTPLMAARLKTVAEHSTAQMANWVWQGTFQQGSLAGYPARGTNQVSKTMTGTAGATTGGNDHGIVFGNWGDMIIGFFGAIEIIVDPLTLALRGMIRVTSFQMIDVMVRHGESFSRATGATTP